MASEHVIARDWFKNGRMALIYALSFLLSVQVLAEDAPSVPTYEQLAAKPEFRQAEISPDGKYLAVDVVHEERRALAVLATEDLEVIKVSGFYDAEVGAFGWVNDERIVMTIVRKRYGREAPGSYGEIYAVNADGSAPKYLYGINADEPAMAYGDVLGIIDDRHILIQSYPYGVKDGIPEALKVNIYSGRISREARSRLRGAAFVADEDMAPRFVQGIDDDNEQVFSYRPRESRDWQDLEMPFGDRAQVLGFEPGSDVLRVIGRSNRLCLEPTGFSFLHHLSPDGEGEGAAVAPVHDCRRLVEADPYAGRNLVGVADEPRIFVVIGGSCFSVGRGLVSSTASAASGSFVHDFGHNVTGHVGNRLGENVDSINFVFVKNFSVAAFDFSDEKWGIVDATRRQGGVGACHREGICFKRAEVDHRRIG